MTQRPHAPRTYASPSAFQQALAPHLRRHVAEHGGNAQRAQRILAMERFLARLLALVPDTCMLKGGLALEFRLARARSTTDIDLRFAGDPAATERILQTAAAHVPSPDDYFRFEVEPDPDAPAIEGDGVRYLGFRFRARATIAGRHFASFGLDVAYADAVHGPPDWRTRSEILSFIGVPPVHVPIYPIATHLAEKVHAYTLPRPPERPNSRLKDLPDIALLATTSELDAQELRTGLHRTFAFRGTHPLPPRLPPPSVSWNDRYPRLAREEELAWHSLDALETAVRAFIDPLLAGGGGTWDSQAWCWR